MTGPGPSAPAVVESVDLPEVGPVSLVPIDGLRQMCGAEQSVSRRLSDEAAALAAAAGEKLADAGAVLVPQRMLWMVPPDLQETIRHADELVSRMTAIDQRRQDLAQQAGCGIFGRISAWREDRRLQAAWDAIGGELHSVLIQVARRALAAGAGSPDALPILEQARRLESDAAEARKAGGARSARIAALQQEITRREESKRQMGFDALYTAAYLQRHGPQPIASPLQLKAGEVAVTAVPCTLARIATRTRYVGGSSGFSFPIGHTGIRYRVGSYRGQQIQRQVLRHLDTGTLVVSTQRLAFLGPIKSVLIQLRKVTHVDIYTDALAVFHEGRETPDFLLLGAPKQVAFYLNWVLQQARLA